MREYVRATRLMPTLPPPGISGLVGPGVYPTGNDGMYHRPEKCVRDAHAKNARDRVSGMHECSIMNFTYCCSLRIAAPPGEQLSLRFTCMNRDAWHGRASNNVKPFPLCPLES